MYRTRRFAQPVPERRPSAGRETQLNSCFTFKGSAAILVANKKKQKIRTCEATGGTQVAWLHDQRNTNKLIFCDPKKYVIENCICPVAGFHASHHAIHKRDVAKLDVEYRHRRLLRIVARPPPDTHSASPWHDTFIEWSNNM